MEGGGRVAIPCLPATADESGAVDAHGGVADRGIVAFAFFGGINIARGFASADSGIKACRRIETAPLVSDTDILGVRPPATFQRRAVTAFAVGCVYFDATRVCAVQNVLRRRAPAVLN